MKRGLGPFRSPALKSAIRLGSIERLGRPSAFAPSRPDWAVEEVVLMPAQPLDDAIHAEAGAPEGATMVNGAPVGTTVTDYALEQ